MTVNSQQLTAHISSYAIETRISLEDFPTVSRPQVQNYLQSLRSHHLQ
ncbi:hypothetical protein H6G64_19425 [Calothrix sp. FACHB-156]|nr:hypothetical protein [Nostoc linckia FACHB-104]MBD2339146.1 hypothetical protein [Calothrix sp. FACHB-156]